MNKISTIFVAFLAVMLCLTVSCKKSSDDDKDDNVTPSETAKFLTADEFASSRWKGPQKIATMAELLVSKDYMTLSYSVKKTISKNTDEQFEQCIVKIQPYTFDAKEGKVSGTGDDGNSYSGTLKSKEQLDFNILDETVSMAKQ